MDVLKCIFYYHLLTEPLNISRHKYELPFSNNHTSTAPYNSPDQNDQLELVYETGIYNFRGNPGIFSSLRIKKEVN